MNQIKIGNKKIKTDYSINKDSHVLGLNSRPFEAIKEGKKKVEYRTNTDYSSFDYGQIKIGDNIKFINESNGEELDTRIVRIEHYKNAKELFKNEGLNNSSSKPQSIEVAIERLEKFTGYKEGIKLHGVWAIEFKLLKKL